MKTKAKDYKTDKGFVYLCGDRNNFNCGLAGKLVDYSFCSSCGCVAGQFGMKTINPEAEIRHKDPNPEEQIRTDDEFGR